MKKGGRKETRKERRGEKGDREKKECNEFNKRDIKVEEEWELEGEKMEGKEEK